MDRIKIDEHRKGSERPEDPRYRPWGANLTNNPGWDNP